MVNFVRASSSKASWQLAHRQWHWVLMTVVRCQGGVAECVHETECWFYLKLTSFLLCLTPNLRGVPEFCSLSTVVFDPECGCVMEGCYIERDGVEGGSNA